MGKKKSTAKSPDVPKKQRTREHIIADISVNFTERFILEEGHACDRKLMDYGYDLTVQTFDENQFAEEGIIYLQLKATDSIAEYLLKRRQDMFSFPIAVEDYQLWMSEPMPVFFVLYDSLAKRGYWQYVQAFFTEHPVKKLGTTSIRLHIPKKNSLRRTTIEMMRRCKNNILQQSLGIHHGYQ